MLAVHKTRNSLKARVFSLKQVKLRQLSAEEAPCFRISKNLLVRGRYSLLRRRRDRLSFPLRHQAASLKV
jgi:hypothetical protein